MSDRTRVNEALTTINSLAGGNQNSSDEELGRVIGASLTLVGDMLFSLDRIATALESREHRAVTLGETTSEELASLAGQFLQRTPAAHMARFQSKPDEYIADVLKIAGGLLTRAPDRIVTGADFAAPYKVPERTENGKMAAFITDEERKTLDALRDGKATIRPVTQAPNKPSVADLVGDQDNTSDH